VGFLAKAAKVMDKIADNEADIIEAGGWGNKPMADKIRPKPEKKGTPKK
jgi:hypothetical protein